MIKSNLDKVLFISYAHPRIQRCLVETL